MPSAPLHTFQGRRGFVIIAACLGWFGLAVQLYLILWGRWVDGASLLGGLVRFCSFFTVVTNTLVAVALSCAISERDSAGYRFFRSPAVCACITTSIVLVSLAYNLLLRHLWTPQGLQWIADELLHDIMPALFVAYWLFFLPKGTVSLRHVLLWTLYPVVYFGYLLLRGNAFGDYLYPFLDIGTLGFVKAMTNALGVLAGFVGIGLIVILIDRVLGRNAQS